MSKPSPTKRQERKIRILFKTNNKCAYCGVDLTPTGAWAPEHVFPKSRGGSNSEANLVAACITCNSRKGNCTPDEFRDRLLVRLEFALEQVKEQAISSLSPYADAHEIQALTETIDRAIEQVDSVNIRFRFEEVIRACEGE